MSSSTLGTLAALFLAAFFFSVPLIVKYRVYRPVSREAVRGDIILLEGEMSHFWCQGLHLNSSSDFETFVFDFDPLVKEGEVVGTLSTHRTVLANEGVEYWGFHLLRGSRVQLSSCARLMGAGVAVLRGHGQLRKCLQEHKRAAVGEDGGEDSLSESESDEDTSSISSSQGAVMNDTLKPHVCSSSVRSAELPQSYSCSSSVRLGSTLSLQVNHSDTYFFVFSSRAYLDIIPNEIFVEFWVERTRYDVMPSTANCSCGRDCDVRLGIGGRERIVVEVKGDPNGTTLTSDKVGVSCRPREWLFFAFYAAFLMVIFISAFQ